MPPVGLVEVNLVLRFGSVSLSLSPQERDFGLYVLSGGIGSRGPNISRLVVCPRRIKRWMDDIPSLRFWFVGIELIGVALSKFETPVLSTLKDRYGRSEMISGVMGGGYEFEAKALVEQWKGVALTWRSVDGKLCSKLFKAYEALGGGKGPGAYRSKVQNRTSKVQNRTLLDFSAAEKNCVKLHSF